MQGTRHRARPGVVQPRVAVVAWAALALFVLYGSIDTVAVGGHRAGALAGISLPDIAQNVLLYIPFGTLGVWALRRASISRLALSVRVIAIAAVYSTSMELLQLLSASRIASSLDVIANVVGASAGAMAAEQVERAVAIAVERVRSTGLLIAPARYALAVVIGAIVIEAWRPFDVTLDVSTLADRTRAVRLDPWLWPGSAELWAQGGRFFILTAILTACLPGLAKRAVLVAPIAATMAAMVIDLGQLAMGSQPVGVAVLLSQVAGVWAAAVAAFGITLARRTWYAAA